MREIAIRGRYSLRYKNYLGDYTAGMKDIEIVYLQKGRGKDAKPYCCTVADFVRSGDKEPSYEIRSCGDRLLESLDEDGNLYDLRMLEKIAIMILNSDEEVRFNESSEQ